MPQRSLHENSFPVALAEVREIERTSIFVEEHELASKLSASALL
ncbi:MAG TPA: hypothetical protein VNF29_11760 [Candidatus Binataceae bacterium]|nr:hypothetical protein [Candidatus Binataceae bacterium]